MNRSLKLSMLMALALGSSQVLAMDLGQVQVKSALGQPLLAEIPLHPANPAELRNFSVQLAPADEFARAGIVGGRPTVPLTFTLARGSGDQPIIRITSATPVDDPFLDLLIVVNGDAGRSVREYAILLDPPGSKAPVAATPAPAATPARQATSAASSAPASAATPRAAQPAAPVAGQVRVERGQTLSGIAQQVTPSGVDIRQMMLALRQANPDAFYRENINALKSGVVLRIPGADEARAMSIAAAAAEVQRQNSDWRAGMPAQPTQVASAAGQAAGAGAAAPAPSTGDRLALVPAAKAGAKDAGTQPDLQRARESIASLEQQRSDLKSRVDELDEINKKNERLLALKDNEIAELQAKLAEARKSAGLPPETAGRATPALAPAPAPAEAPVTPPASTPGMEPKPAADAAAAPAVATSALAEPRAVEPMDAGTREPAAETAKPAAPVKPAPKPMPKPAPVAEQPWYMQPWALPAAGGAVVVLLLLGLLGRRRKSAAKPAKKAGKSGSSLADKFGVPAQDASAAAAGEGDAEQDALLDQLAEHPDDIGLHLELAALYYDRRDIEHFEAAAEAMHAHVADPTQDEWQEVLHMGQDLVPNHPLFAVHDMDGDALAVPPEAEPEDLAGATFADPLDSALEAPEIAPAPDNVPPPLPEAPKNVGEYTFRFDLTHPAPVADAPAGHEEAEPATLDFSDIDATTPAQAPAGTEEMGWNFDDRAATADAGDAGALDIDLGEFSDDPVDTKLDLARAYIDMGDADGARAMLEEVLKEGTQPQQDVARKLIDGLH